MHMNWKYTIAGLCLALLGVSWLVSPATSQADQIGYMLRATARLAFSFLLLAYLAKPLLQLFGVGSGLVKNRRYLGLAMAFTHSVHFYYVVLYQIQSEEPLTWLVGLGGGLAFVLMWLMAATSNTASMRLLGPYWRWLHLVGLHYLWLVFMQFFLPTALAPNADLVYVLLAGTGMLALVLRIAAYWQQRWKRSAIQH